MAKVMPFSQGSDLAFSNTNQSDKAAVGNAPIQDNQDGVKNEENPFLNGEETSQNEYSDNENARINRQDKNNAALQRAARSKKDFCHTLMETASKIIFIRTSRSGDEKVRFIKARDYRLRPVKHLNNSDQSDTIAVLTQLKSHREFCVKVELWDSMGNLGKQPV